MPRTKYLTIIAHCATFFGGRIDSSVNFLEGNLNGKLITEKGNTDAVATIYDFLVDCILKYNSMLPSRGPHVPLLAFYCDGGIPVILPTTEVPAKCVYLGGIKGPIVLILSYQNQVYDLGMESLIRYGINRMAPLRQQEVGVEHDIFGDNHVTEGTMLLVDPINPQAETPVAQATLIETEVLRSSALNDQTVGNYVVASAQPIGVDLNMPDPIGSGNSDAETPVALATEPLHSSDNSAEEVDKEKQDQVPGVTDTELDDLILDIDLTGGDNVILGKRGLSPSAELGNPSSPIRHTVVEDDAVNLDSFPLAFGLAMSDELNSSSDLDVIELH